MRKDIAFAALALMLASAPALGHHSFAMFDQTQTSTRSGVVEQFEYINPHTWLHIAVTDESGQKATWSFEMGSISQLTRDGWTQETIAVGDEIEVGFHPLKDGSFGGQFRYLFFSDGRFVCQGGAGGRACDPEEYRPATN